MKLLPDYFGISKTKTVYTYLTADDEFDIYFKREGYTKEEIEKLSEWELNDLINKFSGN